MLAVAVLAGCAADDRASGPLPAGRCPSPDGSGWNAAIDWVDFVRRDGLMFVDPTRRTMVPEPLLGASLGTVRCTLDGNVDDIDYVLRDGDASFLPVGTPLRALRGYRTDFRIAARTPDGWRLYEVEDVPDARTGEDLLDLRGKVARVDLLANLDDDRVVRRVAERPAVDRLVEAVLAAPVTAAGPTGDESPFILRFGMHDGTTVEIPWFVDERVLGRRISAPNTLAAVLRPGLP